MIHQFETRHQDNLEFAAGDRLSHVGVLAQREELCTPTFLATVQGVPAPLFFFNQSRQLLHANPAALRVVDASQVEHVLGLRMGELLGCDHVMQGADCQDAGNCQNCNSMAAIVAALAGQPAQQEMRLVIHPRSTRRRQVYEVSSIPLPVGGKIVAMVVLGASQG